MAIAGAHEHPFPQQSGWTACCRFVYSSMAHQDVVLLAAFGTIAVAMLIAAVLSFRQALAVAHLKDGDIKMFLWAVATFVSLIIAGLSSAYILLPIIFHIV
jgi:hypothetical protein